MEVSIVQPFKGQWSVAVLFASLNLPVIYLMFRMA